MSSKKVPGSRRRAAVPHEVGAIRAKLAEFLDSVDESGRRPANAKVGVYVFYDYDGEPIYVGQTFESLRQRIGRHLTNQRTDAVAMNVLDPFEVADIELYPWYEFENPLPGETTSEYRSRIRSHLESAEYTVFQKVLRDSALGAVLNEANVGAADVIDLPPPHRGRIIPDDIYELRKHADIRIARRASTIANLARVISERDVSSGLRRTLLTQSRRLETLARARFDEVMRQGETIPVDDPSSDT